MTEIRGHILYDGDCGICKQIAGKLSTTFNKRGFELAPLQEDWVAEKIDVGEEDLLKDMRLL
ncbi:MAG: putative DCC family thiol-disulfide oxidoreductase YuxK, partial [Planctomycetota bacterium]